MREGWVLNAQVRGIGGGEIFIGKSADENSPMFIGTSANIDDEKKVLTADRNPSYHFYRIDGEEILPKIPS